MSLFGKIVGFTGTQQGMSDVQKAKFRKTIALIEPVEFHHGDCVGADADAHAIVREVLPHCVIIVHPPIIKLKRANCVGHAFRTPKEYIDRNHDIVDECDTLVATPFETTEQLRSGTWATVRYARKQNKEVIIIESY